MKNYIAVVNKEQDSAFGLWFPDVPGCFSAADDQEDIIKNAIEALNLHLDGLDKPDARSVVNIANDPEVAAELANGAFLLSIPLVTKQLRTVRVNLSLDKGIIDAIDAAASQRGLTRSAFVAEASKNEIEGRR
jgi:predicted RNase H-like HicB family nuclease